MARDSGQRKSVIPRLAFSHFKRLNEHKSVSSLAGEPGKENEPSRHGPSSSPSSSTRVSNERKTAPRPHPHPHHDSISNFPTPEVRPATAARDTNTMEPIFLGEDFSALLKLPLISSQESLWIDLWQSERVDEASDGKPSPLNDQYLSSLKSFLGLRCLRVTGMLKSYQKQLFQAIWKMEQLEDLQLRMAEEPRLASGVNWRRIEEGWAPRMQGTHIYISPGNGKGRIKKQYGNAEYLDNCVIELAKPKLPPNHPEYESWMARLLPPLVHLTLRGFVVDAIPFCSCFDVQKLRSITFADCYDAGFYLPHEVDMEKLEIRVDELKTARAESIRRVSSDEEVKHITLKDGKKVEEQPVNNTSSSSSLSLSLSNKGTDASAASSRQIGRTSRFPWHFRSHVFKAVIEDERED